MNHEKNTLVIIDADSDYRHTLCEYLNSKGYETWGTSKGLEGLGRVLKHAPSLVIMDLMLTDMDGYELCEKIARHYNHDMRIMALSGMEDESAIHRALITGVRSYVTKPCDPSTVLKGIQALLKATQGKHPKAVETSSPHTRSSLEKENTELKTLLSQKRSELDILSSILQMSDMQGDYTQLVDYLLSTLNKLIEPDAIGCMVFSGKNQYWTVMGQNLNDDLKDHVTEQMRDAYMQNTQMPPPQHRVSEITWRLFPQSRTLTGKRFYSTLIVPLYEQKTPIGVMGIFHTRANKFTYQDQAFLQTVANHLMLSHYRLHQMNLVEQLKREFLLSTLHEGVVYIDRTGESVFYNPAAQRLFSRSSSTDAYADFVKCVHVDPLSELASADAQSIHRTIDINAYPQDLTIMPVTDEKKNTYGVMIVIRDISEELKLERMVNEFISIAAHELRTPLAIIKGSLDVTRDGIGTPEKRARLIDVAEKNIDTITNIVTKLADISSLESLGRALPKRKVLFHKSISDVLDHYHALAKQKGVTMDISMEPEIVKRPICVRSDPHNLKKIFTEVLDNAVRFTPPRGRISVRMSADDKFVRVEVEDTGQGISTADEKIIFQKFKQSEHFLRRTIQGPGLGLPLAKLLLEKSDGDIQLRSKLGRGSTFLLRIPLAYKYHVLEIEPSIEGLEDIFDFEHFQIIRHPIDAALERLKTADIDLVVVSTEDVKVMNTLSHMDAILDVPILYVGDANGSLMRQRNTMNITLSELKQGQFVFQMLPHYLQGCDAMMKQVA